MFTGIITDIGTVRDIEERGDIYMRIGTGFASDEIDMGASIALSGICLTVMDKGRDARDEEGDWFGVTLSRQTRYVTTAKDWVIGTRLNLERALCMGDELGGHIVSGHIDAVITLLTCEEDGASQRMTFSLPASIAHLIAPKGSVALDGISLTVNEVGHEKSGDFFSVNLIPHTLKTTNWQDIKIGADVNCEVDIMARYMARVLEYKGEHNV